MPAAIDSAMSAFLGLTPGRVEAACQTGRRRLRTSRLMASVATVPFRIFLDAAGDVDAVVSSLGSVGAASALSAAINRELARRGSNIEVQSLTVSTNDVDPGSEQLESGSTSVSPSAAPMEEKPHPAVEAANTGSLVFPLVGVLLAVLCLLSCSTIWLRMRRRRLKDADEPLQKSTDETFGACDDDHVMGEKVGSSTASTTGYSTQNVKTSALEAVIPQPSAFRDDAVGRGREEDFTSLEREAVANFSDRDAAQLFEGRWVRLGDSGFQADIRGSMLRYRNGLETEIFFLEDGSAELLLPSGERQRGRILGEELLWDTGDVWSRVGWGTKCDLVRRSPVGSSGPHETLDCWILATGAPLDTTRDAPDEKFGWFSACSRGKTLKEPNAHDVTKRCLAC